MYLAIRSHSPAGIRNNMASNREKTKEVDEEEFVPFSITMPRISNRGAEHNTTRWIHHRRQRCSCQCQPQTVSTYLDFCSRVDYYDDDDYVGQRRRVEIVTTQELLERSLVCCFTRHLVWPKHCCCVAAKYYDFIAISLMKRPVCQAASLKHHDHMFAI